MIVSSFKPVPAGVHDGVHIQATSREPLRATYLAGLRSDRPEAGKNHNDERRVSSSEGMNRPGLPGDRERSKRAR